MHHHLCQQSWPGCGNPGSQVCPAAGRHSYHLPVWARLAAAEMLQLPVLQKAQCSTAVLAQTLERSTSSFSLCCIARGDSGGRISAQGWVCPCWVPSWSCALLGVSRTRFVSCGAALERGDIAGERPAGPGTATQGQLGMRGDLCRETLRDSQEQGGQGLSLPELSQARVHYSPRLMSLMRHPALCNNVFCVTHPNEQKTTPWAS